MTVNSECLDHQARKTTSMACSYHEDSSSTATAPFRSLAQVDQLTKPEGGSACHFTSLPKDKSHGKIACTSAGLSTRYQLVLVAADSYQVASNHTSRNVQQKSNTFYHLLSQAFKRRSEIQLAHSSAMCSNQLRCESRRLRFTLSFKRSMLSRHTVVRGRKEGVTPGTV